MRSGAELARALFVLLLPLVVTSARADVGPLARVGVGMFVPPSGGSLGAALHLDGAYAWQTAWTSLSAGARVSGYLGPERAFGVLAAARCSLNRPLASPFLQLATGLGLHEGKSKLALAGSAGLEIAVSTRLAVGVEASYVSLGRRAFENLYLGPSLRANF